MNRPWAKSTPLSLFGHLSEISPASISLVGPMFASLANPAPHCRLHQKRSRFGNGSVQCLRFSPRCSNSSTVQLSRCWRMEGTAQVGATRKGDERDGNGPAIVASAPSRASFVHKITIVPPPGCSAAQPPPAPAVNHFRHASSARGSFFPLSGLAPSSGERTPSQETRNRPV